MTQKIHSLYSKLLGIFCLVILGLAIITSPLKAQQSSEKEQLEPLRSDVGIVGLTANLHWYDYSAANTHTELEIEFRNIRLLSSHVGVGYKVFGSVTMAGLFEDVNFGESGIGPILRYYPLESKRWQPYVQAGAFVGYKLALGDIEMDVNDDTGIRYRTSLRAGLTYRVTNAFGIFLEAGPTWDYASGFELDSRALQIDLGIELFLFN